jgi:hypothetical protein
MPPRVLQHKVVRRSVFGAGTIALIMLLGVVCTVAWLDWRYRPPAAKENAAALREEVMRLRQEHDALRTALIDTQGRDALLEQAPQGDVVVALPTAFVSSVLHDVVTGWFREVDVHLTNIQLQKAGTVRARMRFLGTRTVGDYTLRLHLADVQGRLEPESPELAFGGNSIGVILPVRLTGGDGRGTLTVDWNSRGLAGPICGDLAATHAIGGTVVPQRYVARGRLRLVAEAGHVSAIPEFPGLAMRLRVRPSAKSVQAMEALLASKGPLCDIATSKGNVEQRMLDLLGRGFLVRIPQHFFRAVRLPIALDEELAFRDQRVGITVVPHTARITSRAVWLSANVNVQAPAGENR